VTVGLRRLEPGEYPGWRAISEARYAQDMVENGGFAPEPARAKAARDFDQTLPDGVATSGHHVFWIVNDEGRTVGSLWLAERDTIQGRVAWVYEVRIDDEEQGRGYGRAAMLLAESEARALGIDRIELNVFGGNDVARGLYRSLGYAERAVMMGKVLA
jgi:GNAT superfamily N-acetyltransferase